MSDSPGTFFSSLRDRPLTRVIGAAASWFLFALCFGLLLNSMLAVMSIGGSCASGGPYVIATPCPDGVDAFTPLSIFGGLVAVAIGVIFAQGFGTPLTTWAWPILFCGLGGGFLLAFFSSGDLTGLFLGLMFEVMGLVPLVIELRGSVQRVFLGQFSANGKQFFEGERARKSLMSPMDPNPDGAVPPTGGSWALSVGITLVAAFTGYQTAVAMFASVGGAPT